jgi:hypothetical protein
MNITEPALLKQYKLLCAVIDAPWATRLDHKVSRHVIDRYYGKFGNARASLRYLERATGSMRTNIIDSLRRITCNGVIRVVRQGIGTRPTEYDLNFDFASKTSSSGPVGETSISGPVDETCSGLAGESATSVRGPAGETESYLRSMSTDMRTVSRNENTPAVPSAPPVVGQKPDTAASAVAPEGFEELWAAFPRKHQRAKARAAHNALAPDRALHGRLVALALVWAEHYTMTDTDKKWWKHLHTWLAEERYLEDLPQPYENPKDAAIARAAERGSPKPATAENSMGLSAKTPLGRHEVVVTATDMLDDPMAPEQRLRFSYRIQGGSHDGREFSHTIKLLSENDEHAAQGQSMFADIRQATGNNFLSDTSDLSDIPMRAIVSRMGRIQYAAL